MTISPSMSSALSAVRMASTAAWSAAFSSPRPARFHAAMAAASVTRTASNARSELHSVISIAPGPPLWADSVVDATARAAGRGEKAYLGLGGGLARSRSDLAYSSVLGPSGDRGGVAAAAFRAAQPSLSLKVGGLAATWAWSSALSPLIEATAARHASAGRTSWGTGGISWKVG